MKTGENLLKRNKQPLRLLHEVHHPIQATCALASPPGLMPSPIIQLETSFFVFSSLYRYAKILKTKAGFFGSVANLVISGVRYGLVFPGWFTVAAVNVVMNSNKDLCMMKPCYYGGTCRVIENEVKCICPRGFLGDRCEIRGARGYFIPCISVQQIMTVAFT